MELQDLLKMHDSLIGITGVHNDDYGMNYITNLRTLM